MDLQQRKLNKSEWDSIEIPVSKTEIDVLKLIVQGYTDVNIKINNNDSIFTFIKIEYSQKMEDFLYNKYLRQRVDKIQDKMRKRFPDYKIIKVDAIVKLNSGDKIRLERNDEKTMERADIYEFVLLNHIEKMLDAIDVKTFAYHYYTLYKLIRNNIQHLNRHIVTITNLIIEMHYDKIETIDIIKNAVDFIEKNESILKYCDATLYEHQKEIITISKIESPKLVLYTAPTGTGKTLTPIALSEKHKIIFVCAARHVGLALARAAISIHKKVAFAFGCSSADDIRLHYFSAKDYSINKRTGGIRKVDNSVGDYVEIMICDIRSYLPAMYYMLAFNKKENIITYWDEPTITLDYEEHDFHKTIRKNWKENLIPNMVLSSATLPKLNELTETVSDFANKFIGSQVYNVVSHDCKKSIPLINKDGYVVVPHYLSDDYDKITKIARHCENYLTISRYFDLGEIVHFITYVIQNKLATNKMNPLRHFETLDDINMKNIKVYYIKLLQNLNKGVWSNIYEHFNSTRIPRILTNETIDPKGNKIAKVRSIGPGISVPVRNSEMSGAPLTRLASEQVVHSKIDKLKTLPTGTSGAYVTTKDAYTLTDGPTIFISDEVEKIAKFCIQQANIPAIIMGDIMKKIDYNNALNEKLSELENTVEYLKEKSDKTVKNVASGSRVKSSKDSKKFNRELDETVENKSEISRMMTEITNLKSMIKPATLNDTFIPNKPHHLAKWAEDLNVSKAFTSNVDEHIVTEIMSLNGISDTWKILLMMGIGVFINHKNIKYTEIMKKLADEQKLYMIIASSDYIYGTNYQFCHAFLSKDLNLTQEKIIQALGRVGRNNIQQKYTLRFRDDSQILKLFTSETEKPEIINMNVLFNSKSVRYVDGMYVDVEEFIEDEEDGDGDEDKFEEDV